MVSSKKHKIIFSKNDIGRSQGSLLPYIYMSKQIRRPLPPNPCLQQGERVREAITSSQEQEEKEQEGKR